MVDDGADRTRAGAVVKESGVCDGRACYGRLGDAHHLSPSRAEHAWTGDRLRHADDSTDHVVGSVSFVSGSRRAGAARIVGQSRGGWRAEHRDLSVAVDL